MSYFVYILHSKSHNRLYKGMTEDLSARLKQHNKGRVKSTKAFIPWKIIYTETFDFREKARAREKYFKFNRPTKFKQKSSLILSS